MYKYIYIYICMYVCIIHINIHSRRWDDHGSVDGFWFLPCPRGLFYISFSLGILSPY